MYRTGAGKKAAWAAKNIAARRRLSERAHNSGANDDDDDWESVADDTLPANQPGQDTGARATGDGTGSWRERRARAVREELRASEEQRQQQQAAEADHRRYVRSAAGEEHVASLDRQLQAVREAHHEQWKLSKTRAILARPEEERQVEEMLREEALEKKISECEKQLRQKLLESRRAQRDDRIAAYLLSQDTACWRAALARIDADTRAEEALVANLEKWEKELEREQESRARGPRQPSPGQSWDTGAAIFAPRANHHRARSSRRSWALGLAPGHQINRRYPSARPQA